MIEAQEWFVLTVCFLSSGFFSGSEAVLMSIGTDRAKQLIEKGGARAEAMRFMAERPNELLTTILVGNNIANIFAAALVTDITGRFFENDAVGIATGFTTLFILIFGEIIPKTFSRNRAEMLSVYVIRILQGLYYLMWPLVFSMTWIIAKVLGKNAQTQGRIVTRNDLEYMVNRAEQEQTMDSKQLEMISSVLEFPTIKVKDVMIPRSQVKFIETGQNLTDIIKIVKEDEYSRYPVVDEMGLDNPIGFLHVKDLAFLANGEKDHFDLAGMLKDPFYVYEHMKIQAVFDHMNRKKIHLALVKDENGLVVGIITLEDIVEEILGDINDEHDDEEVVDVEGLDLENGVIVDARLSLRDLYSDFGVKIPLNDNYSTIAGFLLETLGDNFPKAGQLIFWEGLSFELVKVDENHTIEEVRIAGSNAYPKGSQGGNSGPGGQTNGRSGNGENDGNNGSGAVFISESSINESIGADSV